MSKEQTNEQYVDFHAQACGVCDVESFYDEVETRLHEMESLTGTIKSLSKCPAMLFVFQELFWLRFYNPVAFDLMCAKTIYPEKNYEELAEMMLGDPVGETFIPTRAVWRDKARVSEVMEAIELMRTGDGDYLDQLRAQKLMQEDLAEKSTAKLNREINRLEAGTPEENQNKNPYMKEYRNGKDKAE